MSLANPFSLAFFLDVAPHYEHEHATLLACCNHLVSMDSYPAWKTSSLQFCSLYFNSSQLSATSKRISFKKLLMSKHAVRFSNVLVF